MCDLQLDFVQLSERLNINFCDYFTDALAALQPMADDGLVDIFEDRLEVTPSGRFLLRNLAMPFDAYLEQQAARYSKTV